VVPTIRIKATQLAVISPWCKNCNILPQNSFKVAVIFDSTAANSVYLGQNIHAFKPGLHHTTSFCNLENDTFSNLAMVHQAIEE